MFTGEWLILTIWRLLEKTLVNINFLRASQLNSVVNYSMVSPYALTMWCLTVFEISFSKFELSSKSST